MLITFVKAIAQKAGSELLEKTSQKISKTATKEVVEETTHKTAMELNLQFFAEKSDAAIEEIVSKGGNSSSLRDLMTPEEIARYDEHWLDVAEQLSNEALDNQIQFIKNGGITKPGGGAYKPAKISATVDLNTGEIYIGYNGTNKFNPSRMEIYPSLQERINNTMYLAENTSGNPYASRSSFQLWSVDNCAELYSSNLALHNGASLDNILINTKEFISGKWAPPCENCKVTFEGVYFPRKGQ